MKFKNTIKSDGGTSVYVYPQNQAVQTFYGVTIFGMVIELILYFSKFYTSQNKFLATPLQFGGVFFPLTMWLKPKMNCFGFEGRGFKFTVEQKRKVKCAKLLHPISPGSLDRFWQKQVHTVYVYFILFYLFIYYINARWPGRRFSRSWVHVQVTVNCCCHSGNKNEERFRLFPKLLWTCCCYYYLCYKYYACLACSECSGASVETRPCLTQHNRRCTRNYRSYHFSLSLSLSLSFFLLLSNRSSCHYR